MNCCKRPVKVSNSKQKLNNVNLSRRHILNVELVSTPDFRFRIEFGIRGKSDTKGSAWVTRRLPTFIGISATESMYR
jgi:hypothetical protein